MSSIFRIILLLTILSAGGCYTSQLTLSVLQPADTVLPASLQRISIIPMPGVTTGSQDDLKFLRPYKMYQVKMGYIHGIYSVLSSSPRFTKVKLTDTIQASFYKNSQVYWEDLTRICRYDTSDAILILSKAVLQDDILDYYGYSAVSKTRWVFYHPEIEQTVARLNYLDTVSVDFSYDPGSSDPILYDVCYKIGTDCGKKMVPYWTDVNRSIYTGPGKDLHDAAEFAMKDKWRNAGLIWDDLFAGEKASITSKAAFNLAVAFERDDDLEQAYLWAAYADSLRHSEIKSLYVKVLEKRLKTAPLIERQLSGN